MKIVDLNVLLYAVNRDDPHHEAALYWCSKNFNSSEIIGLAWITIIGFLRLSTRKGVFANPLTPQQALDRMNQWLERPNTRIVMELQNHWSNIQECIREVGTAGNLTTDAHLAVLAISRGATFVSCDTDFARFRYLKWENPLTV